MASVMSIGLIIASGRFLFVVLDYWILKSDSQFNYLFQHLSEPEQGITVSKENKTEHKI
jgi:hypothetical protein